MVKITIKRLIIFACSVLLCVLISVITITKLRSTKELIITGDRNIFFLETSHIMKETITLTPRQCCAVESAARMNPTMNIHLLVFCPASTTYSEDTENIIAQLRNYKNINIRLISLGNYLRNSPIKEWFNRTEALTTSHWFSLRMLDILKYHVLWKYGGIYLDLDVIVKSSLVDLKNFVGTESSEHIGASVFGFDSSVIGRQYANMCLQGMLQELHNVEWSYKKQPVITLFVREVCDTYFDDRTSYICNNQTLTIFKPSSFHPIPVENWRKYFDCNDTSKNETMDKIKQALAIHVWDEHSYSELIEIGSNAPYALTANEYCPVVYDNSHQYF